ncbi:MAG: ATP phosphoribosyltransferase [Nanohaloarchaea archaeon SW_7_43_1]|nr:MAG: ATP phosphoribosyltransferase [Nanohaloarchaea archaeon SW_7_43_1]
MFIGVPKNGSFQQEAIKTYENTGLDLFGLDTNSRTYNQEVKDAEVYLLRPQDVPWAFFNGEIDSGVTGYDLLIEYTLGEDVEADTPQYEVLMDYLLGEQSKQETSVYEELGFGDVEIVFATGDRDILREDAVSVATSYPNIAEEYLSNKFEDYDLVEAEGSVEVFPQFDSIDGVVEVVDSGTTIDENSLEVIDTLFESEAVLLGDLDDEL